MKSKSEYRWKYGVGFNSEINNVVDLVIIDIFLDKTAKCKPYRTSAASSNLTSINSVYYIDKEKNYVNCACFN